MKKNNFIFTIILSLVLYTGILNAAEPQIQEGSKSIFFGFNGLSELSVDNSYFGAQYLFSDKMGFWGQLGIAMTTDKPSKDAEDSTHTDFEIDLGFIYYIFEKGPVACYISPQFGVGFGSGEFYYGSTKFEESTSMFYIGCSIGCEWWFTDGLSLSVRTFLGFESNKDKIEAPSYEQEKTNTVFGIIGDKGPNFSINFYF